MTIHPFQERGHVKLELVNGTELLGKSKRQDYYYFFFLTDSIEDKNKEKKTIFFFFNDLFND